jgi:deoxyadenosine/deoxycytidine kinase
MKSTNDYTSSEFLWDDNVSIESQHRGTYIAITGNTGTGKSSLIRELVQLAEQDKKPILGISERSLHHPYLRLMFANPKDYAFPVQINFLLQRHMVLRRHLSLGRTVVIERSHYDDDLFVKEHLHAGNITQDEYKAYCSLSRVLHAKISPPDLFVILHADAKVSLKRIEEAESRGERPEEFPDYDTKRQWVERWYRLYSVFHAELHKRLEDDPKFSQTQLLQLPDDLATEKRAKIVYDFIRQIR